MGSVQRSWGIGLWDSFSGTSSLPETCGRWDLHGVRRKWGRLGTSPPILSIGFPTWANVSLRSQATDFRQKSTKSLVFGNTWPQSAVFFSVDIISSREQKKSKQEKLKRVLKRSRTTGTCLRPAHWLLESTWPRPCDEPGWVWCGVRAHSYTQLWGRFCIAFLLPSHPVLSASKKNHPPTSPIGGKIPPPVYANCTPSCAVRGCLAFAPTLPLVQRPHILDYKLQFSFTPDPPKSSTFCAF